MAPAPRLGDPIEVEALAAVYGEGRDVRQPFEVGSVKSNIGHLEAASGVTGLLKLVLALQHRQLPASLHVSTPTPAIPWEHLPVRISTCLHDWMPHGGVPRRAGVSAFGFSGMNAHAILEEAPAASDAVAPAPRPHFLLPLSGRSEKALLESARLYADHLERQCPITTAQLADICATAATGRAHFVHRAVLVAPDAAGILTQLRALGDSETPEASSEIIRGQAAARVRFGFLFTGQGSQYVGMGRELYDTEPVFRVALERCAAVLDPLLAQPLLKLLFEDTGGQLDQTGFTQPVLYALQVSLAALWRSWGIVAERRHRPQRGRVCRRRRRRCLQHRGWRPPHRRTRSPDAGSARRWRDGVGAGRPGHGRARSRTRRRRPRRRGVDCRT